MITFTRLTHHAADLGSPERSTSANYLDNSATIRYVAASSPRSVRFDDDVLARLDRYVREHPGTSLPSVANTFVDESLRSHEHPGIVFRPGPTGRRAALASGPDVWEIVAALKAIDHRSTASPSPAG